MKWLLCALFLLCCPDALQATPRLNYGPFGDLIIRGPETNPAHVALVFSSASGWGGVEEQIAAALSADNILTVGVDTGHYLNEANKDPEGQNISDDLEYLYKYAQKNLGLSRLHVPVLVGHAEGAAMVYANMVQAPDNTFRGGVCLAFRPSLGLITPFAEGRGLTWRMLDDGKGLEFLPTTFSISCTVLQAETDTIFPWTALHTFAAHIPGLRLEQIHGDYANTPAWAKTLRAAVATYTTERQNTAEQTVADLPLHTVSATGSQTDTLAVFISGDGGWVGLDKDISATLAARGIDVVGLDSLRYFWKRRTPEEGGRDLARITRMYMNKWHKEKLLLIGYSLGADALVPFLQHMPAELRSHVRLAVLLAPGRRVELEFHVTDWFGSDDETLGFPLLPEIRKIHDVPLLCVHGDEEEASLCTDLTPKDAAVEIMTGSHHFDGDYAGVAARILDHAGLAKPSRN